MKHIVYVVVLESHVPNEQSLTTVDSVWDVFEHADERATELDDETQNARIEGIPMNDPEGGRVHPSRTCPTCDSPMIARMIDVGSPVESRHVPGYECSVCEESERV